MKNVNLFDFYEYAYARHFGIQNENEGVASTEAIETALKRKGWSYAITESTVHCLVKILNKKVLLSAKNESGYFCIRCLIYIVAPIFDDLICRYAMGLTAQYGPVSVVYDKGEVYTQLWLPADSSPEQIDTAVDRVVSAAADVDLRSSMLVTALGVFSRDEREAHILRLKNILTRLEQWG